jgi:hypothetical protein
MIGHATLKNNATFQSGVEYWFFSMASAIPRSANENNKRIWENPCGGRWFSAIHEVC